MTGTSVSKDSASTPTLDVDGATSADATTNDETTPGARQSASNLPRRQSKRSRRRAKAADKAERAEAVDKTEHADIADEAEARQPTPSDGEPDPDSDGDRGQVGHEPTQAPTNAGPSDDAANIFGDLAPYRSGPQSNQDWDLGAIGSDPKTLDEDRIGDDRSLSADVGGTTAGPGQRVEGKRGEHLQAPALHTRAIDATDGLLRRLLTLWLPIALLIAVIYISVVTFFGG